MNVIELLKRQHREAEMLFERIEASSGEEKIQHLGRLAEELTIHAALEEQYFYPLAQRQGLESLIGESIQDHAEVKRLVSELLQLKQTDPRLGELIGRMRRMVREHVEQEERAVLPKVEAQIHRDELDSLGDDMQRAIDSWRQRELLRLAERQEPLPPAP